ncbi:MULTISPECIES: hypothetical protein [Tenacibaculum]|uniref:hypothetical protein n=1 Tax=Tenacibaculum TaxID=104267 RepID=UPI001F0A4D5B|nr:MULTISPECIES: hypothetical protein [Tenacibaculum]MCH3881568.1 hypothetical protein [Tenacibaculum aquimarinum]MDO6598837.1 hypothetical protein [Tenacibaculum sp. 1_MG-2023]
MKRLILTFVLLGAFTFSANAVEKNLDKKNCHEYACVEMGGFEDAFGDDLTQADYEGIYQFFLSECEG